MSAIRMSGFFAAISLHGGLRLFRLTANRKIRFPVNHQRQSLTQQGMVIHYEDSLLLNLRDPLRLGRSHANAIHCLSPERYK